MHALHRILSRLLLLVMLSTVFSPSFGWEAAQVMAPHDSSEAFHAAHDEHSAMAASSECGGCGEHDVGSCSDMQHHCCPGHVLGHLPGGLITGVPAFSALSGGGLGDVGQQHFSSRTPEGLERPPRLTSA